MTCVFYSGVSLSADRAVVEKGEPSFKSNDGLKLRWAKNKQFAYAYCGTLPKITAANVDAVEDLIHRVLVALAPQPGDSIADLSDIVPGWDEIDPDIVELTFSCTMYAMTKTTAYSFGELARYRLISNDSPSLPPQLDPDRQVYNTPSVSFREARTRSLSRDIARLNNDVFHNSRSPRTRNNISPNYRFLSNIPTAVGTGGNFVMGAWYAKPDLPEPERLMEAYTVGERLDPLMSSTVDVALRDDLKPLSVG